MLVVAGIASVVKSSFTVMASVVLSVLMVVCLVYLYVSWEAYQSVRKENKGLDRATVGDIIEVSGTVSSDDSNKSPLFRHNSPVAKWKVERAVEKRGKRGTRWKTVAVGHRVKPFTVRSENGSEATVNIEKSSSARDIFGYLTVFSGDLRIDIHRDSEVQEFGPTEDIDDGVREFLESKGMNPDKYRYEDNISHAGVSEGTLRLTERNIGDGDTVFVRGVLEKSNIIESDVIGFERGEMCIISDKKRGEYARRWGRNIYGILTILCLSSLYFLSLILENLELLG